MYIAIAGNIGSGKSTLTNALSELYKLQPVLESVDENPYLEDFYKDMGRYAFQSQVFFLGKRLEQHLREINIAKRTIQDRTIFEDANVFARNLFELGHLDSRDWHTYQRLYLGIRPALRLPNILIYIQCSLPTLQGRIAKRGRDFEQSISPDYLARLNRLYDQFIEEYSLSPVLVVPGDDMDFVSDPSALAWVGKQLEAQGLDKPILK